MRNPRILVADDHEMIRQGTRAVLETHGDFEICEAEDGKEAIEKVRDLKPDLVILDITMPKLDGLSAAREIRIIAPLTPILIVSFNKTDVFAEVARRIGVSGYISKSDGAKALLAAVDAALENQNGSPNATING